MGFSFLKKKKSKNSDSIEAIIRDVENTPFGVSQENVLYAGLNELGGYYFFQTIIVGNLHFKTMNGAILIIKSLDGKELILKSDMTELESDPSSVANRSITKIDFQVEEKDIAVLQENKTVSIMMKAKKHEVLFKRFEGDDEE